MSMSGSQRKHRCRFTFAFIFAMVAWLAPGAAGAQTYFINEDFATGAGSTPPIGWSNDTLTGLATDKWRFDNPAGRFLIAPITSPAAIFDSDHLSSGGGPEDVVLTSPSVNTTGHPVVRLKWSDHFLNGFGGSGLVEVRDGGGAWVEVLGTHGTNNLELQDIDVSALAANRASVSVRFRWKGNYSWWWIVDNVQLYAPASPTVTINQAPAQADPASAAPVAFAVVFSESVTGFTGADVSLAGSTATGPFTVNVTGSGTTYEVTVSGMTSNGSVVATIPAGVAASSATGALNTASTSTDNTVTLNDPAPTVTINQAAGQADPASAAPINFTVVFSEPVTGFTSADLSFAGSTAAGPLSAVVTGGPSAYDVAVSGMTGNGTVVAAIAAGAATDTLGQGNLASTSTDNTVRYTAVGVAPVSVPTLGQWAMFLLALLMALTFAATLRRRM